MISKFTRHLASLLPGIFCGLATAASAVTIPDVPVNGTTATILGTSIAAIVVAAMRLRKGWSRDGVGREADDYLKEALGHASKERDGYRTERDQLVKDLREAWSTKGEDQREIGRLTAQVENLQELLRQNNELMKQIQRGVQFVGRHVDVVKEAQDSTLAELGKSNRAPLAKNP